MQPGTLHDKSDFLIGPIGSIHSDFYKLIRWQWQHWQQHEGRNHTVLKHDVNKLSLFTMTQVNMSVATAIPVILWSTVPVEMIIYIQGHMLLWSTWRQIHHYYNKWSHDSHILTNHRFILSWNPQGYSKSFFYLLLFTFYGLTMYLMYIVKPYSWNQNFFRIPFQCTLTKLFSLSHTLFSQSPSYSSYSHANFEQCSECMCCVSTVEVTNCPQKTIIIVLWVMTTTSFSSALTIIGLIHCDARMTLYYEEDGHVLSVTARGVKSCPLSSKELWSVKLGS